MDRRDHWDNAYRGKSPDQWSWTQRQPEVSLTLFQALDLPKSAPIIDIGGGASNLVDALLKDGFQDVSVLDVSGQALDAAQKRLGERADSVQWIEQDIVSWEPIRRWDLWHDRVVLHFLTNQTDRAAYFSTLQKALNPGGVAIISGFAPDGPEKCSGLTVARRSAKELAAELEGAFSLVREAEEIHVTPWGKEQKFAYGVYVKER